jgi:PAS domain S-box-containing protein
VISPGEPPRRTTEPRESRREGTLSPEIALRESEERFRGAFEAAAIGFALVEIDGHIRATNRSFSEMLGYTQAELSERALADVTHADDLRAADPLSALLAGTSQSVQLERRYIHKDGHVVWGVLAVSLVRNEYDAPRYFVAQVTDISARKEAEQALSRHLTNLERSNADLEAFAYVASHDLQQPLRTVTSYAQLLADRYRGKWDERADRWIGFIVSGVERMQRLISDLLALARVSTDAVAFAPADTRQIAEHAWRSLRESRGTDGARLTTGELPIISADAAQLHQLFQNLLDNAWKYRRSAVVLHVSITASRHDNEDVMWEFAVRDNGIGLDMTHADHIFEVFRRLHREQDHDGTGIGLAICRRIVERHGGSIWVSSRPRHGATFSFTLPERHPASVPS